jgi:4-hydroxybenzoate polyprenyltransferase
MKTNRLYLSLLAFTDKSRPVEQLRQAMICAVLTAVYDYDTDWVGGNRNGANFLPLLDRLVVSQKARDAACKLFKKDTANALSADGLERGSTALRFYWFVIDAKWMRHYLPEEIDAFGRFLQIVDDLLDLENDRAANDKNCFLLGGNTREYARQAHGFLESEFFTALAENSRVYKVIKKKVAAKLQRFSACTVTFKQLLSTGRPSTGVYAFFATLIGFGFFESVPWVPQMLAALGFAGITMSIMVFNDYVDRHHDRKKAKTFASEHPRELLQYWGVLNGITLGLVGMLAMWDVWTALFCVLVWVIGLLYSFIPHWFITQNAVVACCSGAPILCGTVFNRGLSKESIVTFLLLASLIFLREVYKDTEDKEIDTGYKETLPVRFGHQPTFALLFVYLYIPATLFVFHPNPWVSWLAYPALGALAFSQAVTWLRPQRIRRTMRTMDWTLKGLLVALFAT